MKTPLLSNKDFLAGSLLLTIGCIGFYMALEFPYGSAVRMGPGYFPRWLSGILMAFGVYVLLRGLRIQTRVQGYWGWRPLAYITVGILLFGFLMEKFGLIPALSTMVLLVCIGGNDFRLKEVIFLIVFLNALAWFIFIYLLSLPYPLLWGY